MGNLLKPSWTLNHIKSHLSFFFYRNSMQVSFSKPWPFPRLQVSKVHRAWIYHNESKRCWHKCMERKYFGQQGCSKCRKILTDQSHWGICSLAHHIRILYSKIHIPHYIIFMISGKVNELIFVIIIHRKHFSILSNK